MEVNDCIKNVVTAKKKNPVGSMDMCIFWVLCVIRQRSLRRIDHSSGGFHAGVVSVTECYREASIMRRPWPIEAITTLKKKHRIENMRPV